MTQATYSPALFNSFAIAKVFSTYQAPINSLDFSDEGDLVVTSSNDETIAVYNCQTGTQHCVIKSKKYGADLIRFTHSKTAVLYASRNGWDESIRYLSLHDNSYLRYFKGHRDQVVSLSIHAKEDLFLSASLDRTIKLWDLRSHSPQASMKVFGRPVVENDKQGLVFAVGAENNTIKLYETRNASQGAFCSFRLECSDRELEFVSLHFSPDGKYISATTSENLLFVLDAYTGEKKAVFTNFVNEHGSIIDHSFTPDGKYIAIGSEDGTIHIIEVATGSECAVLSGHSGPVSTLKFAPCSVLLVSGCTNLAWWIPSKDDW